ncbi:MAG: DCC1-like thiol-disulfide oxidoreductase family protein [Nitrospirales bacterium]|nr:DUF393 domain-containing protein [Nitrospira sp.]MDR4502828.1 DCC1-like thiol-disulfide oxidoreductase family protein [Nitrospirales bacterium]
MADLKGHSWRRYPRLILFDGVCTFCIASVDFVIRHDPERKFQFGALQSEVGQQILMTHHFSIHDFETFLYLEHGQVYTKSTAALKVLKELQGIKALWYVGKLIPRSIRDFIYRFIVRRRYQWMGKLEACRTPPEADRSRFV